MACMGCAPFNTFLGDRVICASNSARVQWLARSQALSLIAM